MASLFTLLQYLWAKVEPTRVEAHTGLHSNGGLLALSTYFRLGCKCLAVTNTLAYYDTEAITAVKSFKVQDL